MHRKSKEIVTFAINQDRIDVVFGNGAPQSIAKSVFRRDFKVLETNFQFDPEESNPMLLEKIQNLGVPNRLDQEPLQMWIQRIAENFETDIPQAETLDDARKVLDRVGSSWHYYWNKSRIMFDHLKQPKTLEGHPLPDYFAFKKYFENAVVYYIRWKAAKNQLEKLKSLTRYEELYSIPKPSPEGDALREAERRKIEAIIRGE